MPEIFLEFMDRLLHFLRVNKKLIFLSLVWILFWVVPWGRSLTTEANLYLIFLLDMTKLGIAFGLFIFPGSILYFLLRPEGNLLLNWRGTLSIGFALSVALIATAGVVGRILGFSFQYIKIFFMLSGLIALFLLRYWRPKFAIKKPNIQEYFREIIRNIPLLLALILASAISFNESQFFYDDMTYGAYLINWQYSTQLGFNNIVHHAPVIEMPRFWLALYPMGQALLSDISGIPGILLFSNYLELFLVPLAVFSAYWFANVLGLSKLESGLSILIQMLFYLLMFDNRWPVGFWFFQNLAEDKVSGVFLLSPVFFTFVLNVLRDPTKKNIALVTFCGIGLTLTHPVILLMTCITAMSMALIYIFVKRTAWQVVFKLATVFIVLMLPYASLRLIDIPSMDSIPYDAESVAPTFQMERYVDVLDDVFYGMNFDLLKLIDISPESGIYTVYQIVRLLPVILLFLAWFIALTKLKEGPLYWYIVASGLLVAVAVVPYTGWILGYFTSARMLSRASWYAPLGLSAVLLLRLFCKHLTASPFFIRLSNPPKDKGRTDEAEIRGMLAGIVFTGIMMTFVVGVRTPYYFEVLDRNRQLAQIGSYIDENTQGPTMVIALDYDDMQILPSVSAHATLLSFREETVRNPHNFFLSLEEIRERMSASNTIRSTDSSILNEEKCALINKYEIRFVLARFGDVELFENQVNTCDWKIIYVFETKDLVLLEIK